MADDADPGRTILEDFAPGETDRFRSSWQRAEHLILAAMAAGPVVGAFVLTTPVGGEWLVVADPVKGLAWVVPIVALFELGLYKFYRKNHELLESYAGWELTENGIRFPTRRDDDKELARRFVPYEDVDAVYFRGTSRLVSLVWPTLPDRVRAEYGDDVPRALDDYVIVVETDDEHTAIEKEDVGDVAELKDALRDQDVKVVG